MFPANFLKKQAMYNLKFRHVYAFGKKQSSTVILYTHPALKATVRFPFEISEFGKDTAEENEAACRESDSCEVTHQAMELYMHRDNNSAGGLIVAIRSDLVTVVKYEGSKRFTSFTFSQLGDLTREVLFHVAFLPGGNYKRLFVKKLIIIPFKMEPDQTHAFYERQTLTVIGNAGAYDVEEIFFLGFRSDAER